jgi:predicted ribosome quality control (RQC) complex YloA/Tae2 family protein
MDRQVFAFSGVLEPRPGERGNLPLVEHALELGRTRWLWDGAVRLCYLPTAIGDDPRAIEVDPERTPGGNLEDKVAAVKKIKRARAIGSARLAAAERDIAALAGDLAVLRAGALGAGETAELLARHKLGGKASAEKQGTRGVPQPAAKPFKTYNLGDAAASVPCYVGKGAADNDELTKAAKANDYWLHAVGVTGSHVILPARGLRGLPPAAPLLREAAVLALHFSKMRDNLAGEVYVTRKQHLRKRKGLAAGLWLIDKSETMFVRYDAAELKAVLDKLGDGE